MWTRIHVGYVRMHEVETLGHVITNCIVEIRNNTRMNQVLKKKEEEISWKMKKVVKEEKRIRPKKI